jgi:hypothetical protein
MLLLLQCAIYGNFSAPKAQEIVVSRGHTLELIRPADNGRLQVRQQDSFPLQPTQQHTIGYQVSAATHAAGF